MERTITIDYEGLTTIETTVEVPGTCLSPDEDLYSPGAMDKVWGMILGWPLIQAGFRRKEIHTSQAKRGANIHLRAIDVEIRPGSYATILKTTDQG